MEKVLREERVNDAKSRALFKEYLKSLVSRSCSNKIGEVKRAFWVPDSKVFIAILERENEREREEQNV